MNKLIFYFFALCSFSIHAAESEAYEFAGKHFLASYLDCDTEALKNVGQLVNAMDKAVEASGATILGSKAYHFEPDAVTVVYLLSESHASIHTYPEHGACFVDLFTCGDNCSSAEFDKSLREYLKPKEVDAKLFLRSHQTQEAPLPEARHAPAL